MQELEDLGAWAGKTLRQAAFGLIGDFLPIPLEPETPEDEEEVEIEQLEITE